MACNNGGPEQRQQREAVAAWGKQPAADLLCWGLPVEAAAWSHGAAGWIAWRRGRDFLFQFFTRSEGAGGGVTRP